MIYTLLLLALALHSPSDAFITRSAPSRYLLKQQQWQAPITMHSSSSSVADPVTEVRRDIYIATNTPEEVGAVSPTASVRQVLSGLATSPSFMADIWQKQPFLYSEKDTMFAPLVAIKNAFSMEDLREVVTSDFVEAGRGSFQADKTGWNMAAVSTPKGSSFEEAKMHFDDVLTALKEQNGTVVFNSAGGFMPKVAALCLETINVFNFPAACNMYITNPGQSTSAPPHTDKQDVFVLQTQGRKRWRVFAPPPPKRMLKADPYARGKGMDVLSLSELGEPLIDAILVPGQVLYVPAGYPHTTDTTFINEPESASAGVGGGVGGVAMEPSLHLTVGVDTLIWGLTYGSLRSLCLQRAGIVDKLTPTKLDTDAFFALNEALPFGFLTTPVVGDSYGNGPAMRKALYGVITSELLARMRSAEPSKYGAKPSAGGVEGGAVAMSDEEMKALINIDEGISRLIQHHYDVTDLFGQMYEDVANKVSEVRNDLSLFRSRPYFEQLERVMEGLIAWGKAGAQAPEGGGRVRRVAKGGSSSGSSSGFTKR